MFSSRLISRKAKSITGNSLRLLASRPADALWAVQPANVLVPSLFHVESNVAGIQYQSSTSSSSYGSAQFLAAASLVALAAATSKTESTKCLVQEQQQQRPQQESARSSLSKQRVTTHRLTDISILDGKLEDLKATEDDTMRVFSKEEVAKNDGKNGRPIWMTYGGVVYDVTDFIANHPGGSEKILEAAGSAIEPFWHNYRQHFASELPMKLMERMAIGRLSEVDQDAVDKYMEKIYESTADPYDLDPVRHKDLKVHTSTPMNAEVPEELITRDYLTPPELFYIRNHHPVPFLTKEETKKFRLQIDLTSFGKEGVLELSLDDLKKMKKAEVVTTLQCGGNRRRGLNNVQQTSGTAWGQGAISTAKWGGVYLRDVLKAAGLDDPISAEEENGLEHVHFTGMDGMKASIGIEKAVNPYGDCLIAYEMNGKPLPRDHGYPLRAIVPGYAAVRNVKWLSKIELKHEMADGPWQRGLNYKILPPSVSDANAVNLDEMPIVQEGGLYSGITRVEKNEGKQLKPGDEIELELSGWAWAGGGRNVVRVDVTGDGGETWQTSTLTKGTEQKFGRAWAWVFWECKVPAKVQEDGTVALASKAVDAAFNVQPESCKHTWNVRGLCNTSWYRKSFTLVKQYGESVDLKPKLL